MFPVTHAKSKNRKRRVKYSGIGQAAQELGVHRCHLWLVLTGRRASARLFARYKALQKTQQGKQGV